MLLRLSLLLVAACCCLLRLLLRRKSSRPAEQLLLQTQQEIEAVKAKTRAAVALATFEDRNDARDQREQIRALNAERIKSQLEEQERLREEIRRKQEERAAKRNERVKLMGADSAIASAIERKPRQIDVGGGGGAAARRQHQRQRTAPLATRS
jgi:cytosine/adenosine deaminase-related metal-dependent hydrolase